MEWKKAPEELVQFLAKKTARLQCDYRKMFGYPAYFVNGNMFAGVHGDKLFIRLFEADEKRIMEMKVGVTVFESVAVRVMKGYVVLPKSFYSNDKLFDQWLEYSYRYVSSLAPKKPNANKKKSEQRTV